MSKKDSDKDKGAYRTPAWLKRIQEGSWEPEILISGIVLFGLFKIYPLIGEFNYFLDNNSYSIFSGTSVNESISSILKYANIVLIFGFVTHLLFRSVWAAFVGLSYVYPKGINFENLKYPYLYKQHIKKGSDYQLHIIKLEKVCSTLFAISFLIFMWLLGLVFFLGLVTLFIEVASQIIGSSNFEIGFVDDIIYVLTVVMILDLVSMGGFKRIPYVNKVFYPLYRFSGWITLSFLYRNIYYGLISNHKKWKISLVLIFFFILSFFMVIFLQFRDFASVRSIALAPYESPEYGLKEDMYRSKVQNGFYSKYMHIEDYIIDKAYLELFIVHSTRFEKDWIMPACNYEIQKEQEGIAYDSLKMSCLEKFYGVVLDGNLLEDDFIYQRNSQTGQDGLLSIIDISHLKKGKHHIDLYYDFYNQEEDSTYHQNSSRLTFYKVNSK
ncbi:hypothetical protein [Marivirga sp.]|uniref:hypothetical protein n=1 Tax=Marivirga sp. TaxID=2018662 RepID=UPI003DA6CFA6